MTPQRLRAPTLALPRAATVLPTLANRRTPRPMEPLTAIPQRRATRPKMMRLPMRALLTKNKRMTRTRMLLIRQAPTTPSLLSRLSGTRWVTAMSSLTTWAPSRPLPLSPTPTLSPSPTPIPPSTRTRTSPKVARPASTSTCAARRSWTAWVASRSRASAAMPTLSKVRSTWAAGPLPPTRRSSTTSSSATPTAP